MSHITEIRLSQKSLDQEMRVYDHKNTLKKAFTLVVVYRSGEDSKGNAMDPHKARLKKHKRNQIFEALQTAGLDLREFEIVEDEDKARIGHRYSDASFSIGGDPGHYVGQSVVGDGNPWPYEVYSWDPVMERVDRWAREVKRDLETPDLWAELQDEVELLQASYAESAANTPFTAQEKKQIAERLHDFVAHAEQAYSLSETQIAELNAKVDYLVSSSDRLGRIDWRTVLIGAVAGYVLAAILPPEVTHGMLVGVLRDFGHLYGRPELPHG
jgi:hypothetical protein